MSRPLRILYAGAFYHVTARGNEKKSIFKNDRDYEKFLSYIEAAVERYGAVINAYYLMSNHYHLLVQTPRANLPEVMKYINGSYTSYINTKRQSVGHLFQGRYKAILIDADSYAQELSRYIHLNPVRAEIVSKPEEYRWSSYQCYTGKEKSPKWLTMQFILDCFDEQTSIGQRKYREFVEDKIGQRYDDPIKDAVASSILGGEEFIQRIKRKYLQGRDADRNVPGLTELRKRSVPEIMKVIQKEMKGDERLQKGAGIYLWHRYSGLRLKEIGEYFGISESGVTQASKRFGMRLEKDGKLNRKIKSLCIKLDLSNV